MHEQDPQLTLNQPLTKVVATLGPATDAPGVLDEMLRAGLDVMRINCSHGNAEQLRQRTAAARRAADRLGRDMAVLVDLQGPKIRIERFRDGEITLADGAEFSIDPAYPADEGDHTVVGCSYAELPRDARPGDTLMVGDGAVILEVTAVEGTRVRCRVTAGGELSGRKGLNRFGGGLSAPALTDKDKADIQLAAELEADYVALSFARNADDLAETRELIRQAGSRAALLVKIERAEAITQLESIVAAADAVMVARGDLGVEIGDAELPGVQKRIIALARDLNKPCITATQMMESMIDRPTPTRAEVLDVANAVMDGTDAVMLSAETAIGDYPVETIETIARICKGAERQIVPERASALHGSHFERADEAIAIAAIFAARHARADATITLTESGNTALLLSRSITGIPIYALSSHARTRRRMALYRGVRPVAFDSDRRPYDQVVDDALETLKNEGLLQSGQRVMLTKGDHRTAGATNTLKFLRVP